MIIILHLIILHSAYAESDELPINSLEIANEIQVTHYDCDNSGLTNAALYSIGEVPECKMAPEDVELAQVTAWLYQKSFLRKAEAFRCVLKHQRFSWHCGGWDDSKIHHNQGLITRNVYLSPEECEQASKKGYIERNVDNMIKKIKFDFDAETETRIREGNFDDNDDIYGCDGSGTVSINTFLGSIKKLNLTYNLKTGQILNWMGAELPCKFKDSGCPTTDLDGGAYYWNLDDKCMFTQIRSFQGLMIKFADRYFIVPRAEKPADEDLDLKIEILPQKEHTCRSENLDFKELYKTSYDTLYVDYIDGFNIFTGKNNKPHLEKNPENEAQKLDLKLSNVNPLKPGEQDTNLENLNYELHTNLKMDYVLFRSITHLRNSEIEMLKRVCELERQQIITTLMLAMVNDKLAGYVLTGNRSNFIDSTDGGATAFLYSCKERGSPLRVLPVCYNRIPIDDFGKLRFVDPISRQTFDNAEPVSCDNKVKNLFHMDLRNPNTWYTLTPKPAHHLMPKLFKPRDIKTITPFETYSFTHAGLYSSRQIRDFWENIVTHKKGAGILKILTSRLAEDYNHQNSISNGLVWRDPSNSGKLYIDKLISPTFFQNSYVETFGTFAYWLTMAGTWFATFMLLKFILSVIVSVCRTYHLNQITASSIGWTQVVLDGVLNTMTVAFSGRQPSENEVLHGKRPLFGVKTKGEKSVVLEKENSKSKKNKEEISAPPYDKNFYPQIAREMKVIDSSNVSCLDERKSSGF